MKNNNLERRSVLDIVEALENKTLNPKELSKGTLKECIRVMRGKGYSSLEVGQTLKISTRSVQRCMEKIRRENVPKTSVDFQKGVVGEVINNLKAQYYRLIKISYMEDITCYERIRAIFAACQILKDATIIMERFGFLSKQKLEEPEQKESESLWNPHGDPLISIVDKLLPKQREQLLEFIKNEPRYTEERLLKIAKLFLSENKKLGLYGDGGNLQTSEPPS